LSGDLSRRSFALGAFASLLLANTAYARPRTPVGGKISLRVPWPLGTIDPHRIDDAAAAIFGDGLFDNLYARDESGAISAQLAEGDPEPDGATLRVKLRAGLKTAKGRAFEPRDAVFSLGRARDRGARAWLADIPTPRVDGRSLVFAMRDASRLVRALASPLVAMVPSTFASDAPDGTGPLRFTTRGDAVALVKNPLAARGPAFLDEVVIRADPDRKSSLRAFEGQTDDLGWHGLGLHDDRPNARPFDLGAVGWAILCTGRDASDWDAPGVAQTVCDGVPYIRVKEFNVGAAWPVDSSAPGWGGPAGSLVVRDDSPWLVGLAQTIAVTISRPGHEITARPIPAAEFVQRRASRSYTLALDVARPVAPGGLGAMVALATADGAAGASGLVTHPPKIGDASARTMTRTLRSGVVGEIRVQGGRIPEVQLATASSTFGFDFGATTRRK
jgi:peptide/nickel transport system substrate-binding protein